MRTGLVLLLLPFLGACEAPPQPTPPRAPAAAPTPDRTVWDGLARGAPGSAPAARAPAPFAEPSAGHLSAAPPAPPLDLRTLVGGLSFDHEPLDAALKRVQLVTGAPIVVTPAARRIIADQAVTVDFDLTAPLRLEQLLGVFAAQSRELGFVARDGVVWLTTRADARGPMRLRMYDVRDLLMARPNFAAPRIRGLPTGEEEVAADEPEPTPAIEPERLADLIRNATDPRYWEETEGASLEITQDGMLLVRADEAMQRRIGGSLGGSLGGGR